MSIYSVEEDEDSINYLVDFLRMLNTSGTFPYSIALKIKAQIMLLQNLNPPRFVNSITLQVKSLKKNIEATIFTSFGHREIVLICVPLIPPD